ncbi:MAG: hypothetical protein O3A82_11390 [Verrucomicrobia bacterium]|nr:hypothetical protein [Verrucomicrobiota bacterium]MDA1047520.1 hypothetical protein [Verrucomicrobiota bacterium]
MVLALPASLHAEAVYDDRIASNALPQSTSALQAEVEKISSAVSDLDHQIAMEWDRRASLLHRINDTREPLPALVNLYKRLERQNKLERLLNKLEQSKTRVPEKRREVASPAKYIEVVEPTEPATLSDSPGITEDTTPKISARKGRPALNRGKYYLFPFAGALFPSDTTYELPLGDGKLSGNTGFTAGLTGGRRFGNWTSGLSLGLNHYKFNSFKDHHSFLTNSTAGKGESYLINLSGRLGYTVPLSKDLWLRFGGAGGLGYRAEGGMFYFGSVKTPLETSKKATLSYEGFAELGYRLTEHLRAGIGCRYLGAAKHGNFGAYGAHSIEVGLGGDF